MRILLVSQMYPGPEAPDLGVFVKQIADALEEEGNELERVVIDRRGGTPAKYGLLAARAAAAARRFRPEAVYAHFLFPAGAAGALSASRPLAPSRGARLGRGGASLPLCRNSGRAQERRPPRGRVQSARAGKPCVRGRRAAPREARGPAARPPGRPRPARARP